MATRQPKTKLTAFSVPQSDTQADQALNDLGETQRQIEAVVDEADARKAAINTQLARELEPLITRQEILLGGLYAYAAANRDRLTNGGRTKLIKLPSGTLQWRMTPPKVTIRGVDDVLARLRQLGLDRFIRTKDEPNRENMLAEPAVAASVEGISVTQQEEFFAKPNSSSGVAEAIRKLAKTTGR